MSARPKPQWWLLYAVIPLMIVLFALESQMHGSLIEHRVMEFGIVLLTFGLMAMWVRANEAALIEAEVAYTETPREPDAPGELALDRGTWLSTAKDDDIQFELQNVDLGTMKGRYN